MAINEQFWRGRRVFLTGHTGFKGAWLTLWLQKLGADVTGFALPPHTTPSLFEVAHVADGMHSVLGDIRNPEQLHMALQAASPEIVIHLAAQALVRHSYADPVGTYSTNVMGLVYLLEGIRQVPGIRAVINVTSDKCYDNREWVWGYREIDPIGGRDPYSNSKGCAELVTAAYRSSYFQSKNHTDHVVALATARAGNVIGGGDWAVDRLIPDIVRALSDSRTINLRNPQALRPWQHVLDPLAGYLTLAERLYLEGSDFAEAWNFGPATDDSIPVQRVVEKFASFWGKDSACMLETQPQYLEATQLRLDCAKATVRLGWKPKWPLDIALEQSVVWYQAYFAGKDMSTFTHEQIDLHNRS